ncbi:TPA: helix-turn-helix domain-containing protein [Serratia marcescens]|uniref:helix-turn-helix domain-containing protein n=1 Tax=Serratia bockelmannii TaxID=2703793 RepID=UPI00384D6736
MVKEKKQRDHISTLLTWIDNHLESPIALSAICDKSGYSERHLQRMFKEVTGLTISSYITKRRLYRCAVDIKMTKSPIEKIADKHQFNSAAVFSRAFLRQFGVSPKQYRFDESTDLGLLSGLLHAADLERAPDMDISYVYLGGLKLFGTSKKYCIPINRIDEIYTLNRFSHENLFSSEPSQLPKEIYGVTQYNSSHHCGSELEVEYSIGVSDTNGLHIEELKPLSPLFGDYIMVTCKSISVPFFDVCKKAYWDIIFKSGLTRRPGREIEKFVYRSSCSSKEPDVDYFFMLPIKFDEKMHHLISSLAKVD